MHLRRILAACDSDDIIQRQWKLQRYFFWEYEDHDKEDVRTMSADWFYDLSYGISARLRRWRQYFGRN